MALEIEGKLFNILPEQTGEGQKGPWKKQTFVMETLGDYPNKICFNVWNERVDELKKFAIGSILQILFRAESREYQQKWYTDLTAIKISSLSGSNSTNNTTNQVSEDMIQNESNNDEDKDDDMPF